MLIGGLERSAFVPFMTPFFSAGDWLAVFFCSLVAQIFVWLVVRGRGR